jgi:hypothetical protein
MNIPSKKAGTVPHGHETWYNKICAKEIADFPENLLNILISPIDKYYG